MSKYYCPLCSQEVSKNIYEKITGIWQEKEKKLASLKVKEKELQKKATELKAKFETDKEQLTKKHEYQMKKHIAIQKRTFDKKFSEQNAKIQKEKDTLEKRFQKKLNIEAKKANEIKLKNEAGKEKLLEKHESQLKNQHATQQKLFDKRINEEKEKIKKERAVLEERFNRKLDLEMKKIVRDQNKQLKQTEKILKAKFEQNSQDRIEKAKQKLSKEKAQVEKQQKLQKDRNEKILLQYKSLQDKNEKQLEKASKKIKLLEEQLQKNQTPQVLGLLEEKIFLAKLKEEFPNDSFEHTGKKGDIIHYIFDKNEQVGTIVYELKKVSSFSKTHVLQTRQAKQQREANYGILITNAKRSKSDSGFSISQGIIIIHPAGALVLITILRTHLIEISRLNLSREEKNKTIKAVLEYIQSSSFSNSLGDIIQDTIDLHSSLKKEVDSHVKQWEFRINKYRNINSNANSIDNRAIKLLAYKSKSKSLPRQVLIEPIALPEKIK